MDRRNSSSSWFSSLEAALGLALQIFEEAQRALAGVGHAVFEHEVGEIAEAEQLRLLAAQLEDAREQRAVVALRLGGAHA